VKILKFEDFESWKEARMLVKEVYSVLGKCHDHGFKDQMQRAAVSIMSNIAEGFERGGNRKFIQFLTIARGSVAEVKSLAYAGLDIGYFDQHAFDLLLGRCNVLLKLLNGFLKFLQASDRKR
jgi:four helix bundle protein